MEHPTRTQRGFRLRTSGCAGRVRTFLRPKRPVIGFDENKVSSSATMLVPVNPKPGQPKRIDSEYERHGSVNFFGLNR